VLSHIQEACSHCGMHATIATAGVAKL